MRTTVPILNISRMNNRVQQQPYRIDKDMPLFAFDFFAGIVPMRVNLVPPFRRFSRSGCR